MCIRIYIHTYLEGETKSMLLFRGTCYQDRITTRTYILCVNVVGDRMRSAYYAGGHTNPGTYYQG